MYLFHLLLLLAHWSWMPVAIPVEEGLQTRAPPPCIDLNDIDDEFFFSRQKITLTSSQCLFYTFGLTKTAQDFADQSKGLKTIWDTFRCRLYNDKTSQEDPNNALRCIMDNGDRREYFRRMSRAYAFLCSDLATLMTKDPRNIPDNGIWGTTEQPTLQRTTNFASPRQMTLAIDACEVGLLNCGTIFKRSTVLPLQVTTAITTGALNRLPRRSIPRALQERQDSDKCFTNQELEKRFNDIDW